MVKNSLANTGDTRDEGSIPGLERSPEEGNGNHLERKPMVFLPGKFNRQRSLESYSPWGHKKLDTTERQNNNHPYG